MIQNGIIYNGRGGYHYVEFGDTSFTVPSRYVNLTPKGLGAQGTVW